SYLENKSLLVPGIQQSLPEIEEWHQGEQYQVHQQNSFDGEVNARLLCNVPEEGCHAINLFVVANLQKLQERNEQDDRQPGSQSRYLCYGKNKNELPWLMFPEQPEGF